MFFRAFAALSALIFCLMALLFLPDVGAQAARDALALCAQTVIPSLFPFFVLSSLLVSCGAADTLSHLLSPLMRPLFGLSGTGAAALGLAHGDGAEAGLLPQCGHGAVLLPQILVQIGCVGGGGAVGGGQSGGAGR